MTKEQCLKRAAECNRIAEATSDPDMKLYLMKLALTWMQSAAEADEKGRAQQALIVAPDAISAAIATAERPPQIVGRLQVFHCTIIQVKT